MPGKTGKRRHDIGVRLDLDEEMPNACEQLWGGDGERFAEGLRPGDVLETGTGHLERRDLVRSKRCADSGCDLGPGAHLSRGGIRNPPEMIA